MNAMTISIKEITMAHTIFLKKEVRDLFYRVAMDYVSRAIEGQTELTLAEALSVLLLTWNSAYYRFRGFDENHLEEIEGLLEENLPAILDYREREIVTLEETESRQIEELFADFEKVLGPVGTAKALHLLAPRFFPLWDRKIAKVYGFDLGDKGSNSKRYLEFMKISREQCIRLKGKIEKGQNILKLLDEYNYCKYTKGWI